MEEILSVNPGFKLSKKPTVSVLLPFFNAESTLERAVGSIAVQTFRDFECILIDNNSTDRGAEIAAAWEKRDKRFILIGEREQGPGPASNAGYRKSSGRYIARMDADDRSTPDRLERQVRFLDERPDIGAVAGLVEYVGHADGAGGFARYVSWSNSVISSRDIANRRFVELPVVNPAAMWRREVAEQYGLYRQGDFPEDYEMWLRWLGAGVRVEKLPAVVLRWYDSEDRLTRRHPAYSNRAFYNIKSKYLSEWLMQHNPHHPDVAVWGASRISRRRAALLSYHGIKISCYIDIKRTRKLNQEVLFYKDIPDPADIFILVYVAQPEKREETGAFLNDRGFTEGENYLFAS